MTSGQIVMTVFWMGLSYYFIRRDNHLYAVACMLAAHMIIVVGLDG